MSLVPVLLYPHRGWVGLAGREKRRNLGSRERGGMKEESEEREREGLTWGKKSGSCQPGSGQRHRSSESKIHRKKAKIPRAKGR